jgi:hypothetical protein
MISLEHFHFGLRPTEEPYAASKQKGPVHLQTLEAQILQGDQLMPEFEANESLDTSEPTTSSALRAIGWVSIGVGLAAVSLFVGRELRKRYKFAHRTPYDFYANAGSQTPSEFGMGI